MKITQRALLFFFSSFLLISCSATKHTVEHADVSPKEMNFPKDTSSAELKRIKALAGRWKSTTSMFGKENEEVFTEYKISAGGSAVVETIFPGTPQEMISVYYDDNNGKLAMTHYCMLRNRPQFTLVESSPKYIKLDVQKVDGQTSADTPSMGTTTLRFLDKNNYETTCDSSDASDTKHEPMTMHFSRVEN